MSLFDSLSHAFNWVVATIEHFFGKLDPALEAWLKKFLSEEGKIILAAALQAANDVINGKSTQDAADLLIATLATQGIALARQQALDAIRTQLSFLQPAPPPAKVA